MTSIRQICRRLGFGQICNILSTPGHGQNLNGLDLQVQLNIDMAWICNNLLNIAIATLACLVSGVPLNCLPSELFSSQFSMPRTCLEHAYNMFSGQFSMHRTCLEHA